MELQVHHIEMLRAKAQDVLDNVQPQPIKGALGAHDLYDIYRDIQRTKLEQDEALAEMNHVYGAALETASKDEAWSRLFSSLDTSAPKTAAASMKSASEISGLRSAFKTYKGFTESRGVSYIIPNDSAGAVIGCGNQHRAFQTYKAHDRTSYRNYNRYRNRKQ